MEAYESSILRGKDTTPIPQIETLGRAQSPLHKVKKRNSDCRSYPRIPKMSRTTLTGKVKLWRDKTAY